MWLQAKSIAEVAGNVAMLGEKKGRETNRCESSAGIYSSQMSGRK